MQVRTIQVLPRAIRPVADPLGLYIRVGRADHVELLNLISQSRPQCFGFVFPATQIKAQRELRELVLANRFDAILDPRTQPAATVGGHTPEISKLPWARDMPHVVDDFVGSSGRRVTALIAECVVKNGFTEVLAPTHLLQSSSDDWFAADCDSARRLRGELDNLGGRSVQILYSLAIPYSVFRDPAERRTLVRALRSVPLDALWLRIEGLGVGATAAGVRNYIEGAADFASLNAPIVADGTGGIAGLSVLAFGGAGGIAHGLTFGERVDNASWRRPRSEGGGFGPTRRVYLPDLDLMLEPETATSFLRSSSRAHGLFACRDTGCCPRGLRDMIEEPARHFLVQRIRQVANLGRAHLPLRAERFLEEHVRPVTDALVEATNLRRNSDTLTERLTAQRKRVDSLRVVLARLDREVERRPVAEILPPTRAARELRANH